MLHKGRTSGEIDPDGFSLPTTWPFQFSHTVAPNDWARTKTGELRSYHINDNGELRMSTTLSTGIQIGQLSTGVASSTRGLYRIHLIYGDLLDEVVTDGIFADYRIVAKDLQDAREKAIYRMGQEELDLNDYEIVVELIGYF